VIAREILVPRTLAAALSGFLLLVPPPSLSQEFADVTEVIVIEVPVHVVKDGRPVRGLGRENFELYDGRKRQEISAFEVIELTASPAGGAPEASTRILEVPIGARRHFLFLFDLSFSEPSAIVRARAAATDVVAELHPSDLVAVASYTLQRGPELALAFTPDRRQVELAIDTLGLPQLIERHGDPLGLVLADVGLTGEQAPGGGGGRPGRADIDGMIREQLRDLSIATGRNERDVAQGQVQAFSAGFAQLANVLRAVEGRKHVVLLSEGFDTRSFLGTDDVERTEEINRAVASGEYWKVDSDERYGDTATIAALEEMLEQFRRVDASIQSVDIGGLRATADAGERNRSADSLFTMARETGGELFANFNDLGAAMGQMLDRTSVTYLLAFQPRDLELDGSYHRLEVKLKDAPGGARVVHRPGYYAPRPYAEQAVAERRLDAAESLVAGDAGGAIESKVLAAAFRREGRPAYVPLFLEVGGASLLAGRESGGLPLEVYAYAFGADGGVLDFFSQDLQLDLAKTGPALAASGLKFFGDLELPPGEHSIRVLVRDAERGRMGMAVTRVSVPGGGAALLPPLFPEPANKWLLVREAGKPEDEVAYPFMLQGNPFIPAARPAVPSRGEQQFVLMAYDVPAEELALDVRVLGRDGSERQGTEARLVGRDPTEDPALQRLLLAFRPNGLAPGEYTLELIIRGAPSPGLTSSLPFEVIAE
jgi:VWFA-related protein